MAMLISINVKKTVEGKLIDGEVPSCLRRSILEGDWTTGPCEADAVLSSKELGTVTKPIYAMEDGEGRRRYVLV